MDVPSLPAGRLAGPVPLTVAEIAAYAAAVLFAAGRAQLSINHE